MISNYSYRLYIFSFVFYLLSSLSAQELVLVKGTVFDAQTKEPLAGANLLIESLDRGSTSDISGHFLFSDIPHGDYIISASFIGYKVNKQKLNIKDTSQITMRIELTPTILEGQSIEVTATRAADGRTPVTFTNITQKELSEQYTASDIPILLDQLPNVYSYSLTGDNLGYSFLKIRGFDQSRVGVMVNDIPLNDPEDQQVYWVDHPDLAESVQDIQVQRGVGSSMYGTSTFGGSVNIRTKNYSSERIARITLGGGSFNTRKVLAEYKSGLIANSYGFYGRFSRILSDGYRRNSSSDLLAFFLGIERYDRNMVTRLNIINGVERTHPDWDGVPQDILKSDRRWKKETYENAVDNFTQPVFQLINDWQISNEVNLNNSFFLVHGEGYYENLKINANLMDYGMSEFETIDKTLFDADSLDYYRTVGDSVLYQNENGNYIVRKTDLTRQKYVDKNQYGWIGRVTWDMDNALLTFGSSLYYFKSDHHGQVLWAKNIPSIYDPERKYYKYNGEKTNLSLYLNYLQDITPDIVLMANILYEHKIYNFKQNETALFSGAYLNRYEVVHDFISPRLGIQYHLSKNWSIFGNVSQARREPADHELFDTWTGPDDLGASPLFNQSDTIRSNGNIEYVRWDDPYVQPETVIDYEAGISYTDDRVAVKLNLYHMDFSNEIVPLGGIDKDGVPVKGNADKTIHQGVEISAMYQPVEYFKIDGNFAYSKNRYDRFLQQNYSGGTDDLSGNSIAGFPDMISNLRMTGYWHNLRTSLAMKHVGKQYLDNTQNENRVIDPFLRFDLMLEYRFYHLAFFPEIRFLLQITNLLNEEYETAGYYDSWAGMAYLYPAATRNFYFSVGFGL